MNQYMDAWHLMSYDMHGSWEGKSRNKLEIRTKNLQLLINRMCKFNFKEGKVSMQLQVT